MHPGDAAVIDLVKHLQASPVEKPRSGQTHVLYKTDPNFPGLTEITIFSPTITECQAAIDRVMRYAEMDGCDCHFIGPRKCLGGFGARGNLQVGK